MRFAMSLESTIEAHNVELKARESTLGDVREALIRTGGNVVGL